MHQATHLFTHSQSMEIQRSGECGNSPKNRLLEDLAVALLSGDGARVAALTTATVHWRTPDSPPVDGQDAVSERAARTAPSPTSALTIRHVVSHGRAGAVTAALQSPSKPATELCLFFTFASAAGRAVDSITTYRAD